MNTIPENKSNSAEYDNKIPESLPGIDVNKAMERLNGNHRLYRSLLFEFHRDYAEVTQTIRSKLTGSRKDDLESVKRLAHTVRGMAGNISALRLFDAAVAFDNGLKGDTVVADRVLEEFETALDEVMAAIDTIKQLEQKEKNLNSDNATAGDAAPLELEAIVPIIKELAQRLDHKEFRSQKSIDNLKPLLAGATPDVCAEMKRLEEIVDQVDFKSAKASLAIIVDALGVNLEDQAS
jgi:two-component system, sensor histidine kinase and response regulator